MSVRIGKYFWSRVLKQLTVDEMKIKEDFHKLFYTLWKRGNGTLDTSWMGWRVVKSPLDLIVYQEIIAEYRPTLLIETGTRFGGSALFFASMFDLLGQGRVVSIDVENTGEFPIHDRITYLTGHSCEEQTLANLRSIIQPEDRIMVVLDSDHSFENVYKELQIYAPLVSSGQYLVCEDTNLNGHPVRPDFGPGPAEAVASFLSTNDGFSVDLQRERFLFTVAPGGFLKKK